MQCKWCSDNVLINDTATTDIYTDWHTLARHDALPIWHTGPRLRDEAVAAGHPGGPPFRPGTDAGGGVHHGRRRRVAGVFRARPAVVAVPGRAAVPRAPRQGGDGDPAHRQPAARARRPVAAGLRARRARAHRTAALPCGAAAASGPDLPAAVRGRRPPAAAGGQPRADAPDARYLTAAGAHSGATGVRG